MRLAAVCCAAALAGCAAGRSPVPASIAASKPLQPGLQFPVHYIPASGGLPQAKMWRSHVAFADVNGDGFADLGAVTRFGNGPFIWISDGAGNWSAAANGLPRDEFHGGGIDFGDVNNDGKIDVAIADISNGVSLWLGDGAGNWKPAPSGPLRVAAEDVKLGDFDHDGCTDLVLAAHEKEGVRAFRGDCRGNWIETSGGLPSSGWANSVVLADMNGDGHLDIVATYSAGPRVWLGNGRGTWADASAGLPTLVDPNGQGLYWGVAVGDVNGDGKLDIVTGAAKPGVEVFLQGQDGTFRASLEGIRPMNALGVAVGDLDRDGKLDLVAVGKMSPNQIAGVWGVFVYKGDGAGHWSYVDDTGLPTTGMYRPWGVALGDMNGDGVLDIAVAFGDVLSPTMQHGVYGSINVWKGELMPSVQQSP